MSSFWAVVPLALIPLMAFFLGGTGAILRPPARAWSSGFQHFAAGVVFAAVAGELLPEVMKAHTPLGVILGFALGVMAMLGLRRFSERRAAHTKPGLVAAGSFVLTVGADVLIDGLLLGVSFAAGERVGRLLLVALGTELLFLGVATVASLGPEMKRAAKFRVLAWIGLAFAIGAGLGLGFLRELVGLPLQIALSFGSAVFIYLVTEELLVEAHETMETPLLTAFFFVGFVMLFVLELMAA